MNASHKPLPLSLTLLIVLTLFLSSALLARPVSAASIVVNSNADVIADDGMCTLREAIDNANNDNQRYSSLGECAAGSAGSDTITFAENYTITLVGSQLPIITSEIIITGNGAANTIIQASTCNPVTLPDGCTPATHRVFEVTSGGDLTLDSVTVRHGKISYYGGGIYSQGILQIKNSTLDANTADWGGGIFHYIGNLQITNSTLSGNSAVNGGGGILNVVGPLIVTNSTLSGNMAYDGGGIFNQGELWIIDSTLLINTTEGDGGGIFNMGYLEVVNRTLGENTAGKIMNGGNSSAILNHELSQQLTVVNSTLSGNEAGVNGGGIHNEGTLTVENSTLSENSAGVTGGGLHNEGTLTLLFVVINGNEAGVGGGIYTNNTLIMTDSTLSGNSAYDGGGIYTLDNLLINNSTLSGNMATFDGGGILNVGTLNITNSTLSGNQAGRDGGGILNDGTLALRNVTLNGNAAFALNGGGIINFDGSTMKFINTIVAHSTGGDCVNLGTIHTDSTHNLVMEGVNCGIYPDDDPMLGPLADNGGPTWTHGFLSIESPAIDAGSNDHCPVTDQRGAPRPQDGNSDGVARCDIGAFEFNPAMDGLYFIYLPLILR